MRESNFAFPAQNKACVCINTQLYDRRALDTTSNLPLLNSLLHLRHLTATSPRIREIMTMDGGLERLVRILYDFCLSPPPPDNPALVYGLSPPGYRPSKPTSALNPAIYDKHAAFRFSQAFECVVNIGVRGSEPIRSRVVQAGTLDVVGCVLEAWLVSKGFAIGPSSSATGIPRESREQRQARRLAQAEQRQREEAAALARALQRQIVFDQMQQQFTQAHQERARQQRILGNADETDAIRTGMRRTMPISDARPHAINTATNDNDESAIHSSAVMITPTVSRDRSGTVVAHHQPTHINPQVFSNPTRSQTLTSTSISANMQYRRNTPSPSGSTDTSRAETETEDEPDAEHDADGDIDMDRQLPSPSSESARPPRPPHRTGTLSSRRQVLAETRLHINANIAVERPPRTLRDQRNQEGSHHALHHPQPQPHQNLYPPHYLQGHGLEQHGQLLSPGSAVSTPASGSASPSPERGGQGGIMRHHHPGTGGRQVRFGTVAVADRTATITMPVGMSVVPDTDPHIVISDPVGGPGVVGDNINMAMGVGMGVGGVGMGGGVVEEDMVSLQANDDFAMGAPPGAPGAIVIDPAGVGLDESGTEAGTPPPPPRTFLDEGRTPRAGFTDLPDVGQGMSTGVHQRHYHHHHHHHQREVTVRGRSASVGEGSSTLAAAGTGIASASTSRPVSVVRDGSEPVASDSGNRMALDEQTTTNRQAHVALSATEMTATVSDTPTVVNGGTGNTTIPVAAATTTNGAAGTATAAATTTLSNSPPLSTQTSGLYRDEDVLLGLQLLAYLSKYPHVRQAFYKPRPSFHPASLGLHQASAARAVGLELGMTARDAIERERQQPPTNTQGFFRSLAGRGRAALNSAGLGGSFAASTVSATGTANLNAGSAACAGSGAAPTSQPRQTNVFSLVERFTFKPNSNEADLPNPPPRLPPEIQYWAGVIMRNACRKDESRGGIRQCANMLCGRWEQYPREFAKCRRCRKAKYCGKECQSTAWSEGHRFWCSARDGDDEGADRDRRGDQDHREDPNHPPQGPSTGQQVQGVLEEGITATTGTMPGGLNIPSALPISPRAERAARRERERRMRELTGAAVIGDSAFIATGFHGRLNPTAGHGAMFAPPRAPSPINETQHAPSPLAGPSFPPLHGAVLTEAAAHQQRIHDQRLIESDWFGQPQAGPSRLGWQVGGPTEMRIEMEEEMNAAMVMAADGTDMVLG